MKLQLPQSAIDFLNSNASMEVIDGKKHFWFDQTFIQDENGFFEINPRKTNNEYAIEILQWLIDNQIDFSAHTPTNAKEFLKEIQDESNL